jgi:type II secretory pathway predicted ATPase ExeA
MYTNFYNLKEKPFNLTPSPRFVYFGETHKEALALLTYGVMEQKGFVLLTGEVGTGKTTMVHALLKNLYSSVKYVYLTNPILTPKDFLSYVGSGLGLTTQFKSKGPFLLQFEQFLKKFFQYQKNALLVIDEAHKLSAELLEEIRLLSNIETADKKLINIFLVGQPELNEKLNRRICKPLLQRISIRYHITPLDLEGTQEYIATRLKVAGAENGFKAFPKSVTKAIHQYSEGYPRMINILADNALLLGYSRGKKKITPAMIQHCYEDMKLNGSFSKSSHKIPEQSEQHEIKKVEQVHPGRYLKWATFLFFIIVIVAIGMNQRGQNGLSQLAALIPVGHHAPFKEVSKEQPLVIKRKIDVVSTNTREKRSTPPVQREEKEADTIDIIAPEEPKEIESTLRPDGKETWKTVIVKQGDSFSKLLAIVYGRASENNLKLVQKYNPQIEDINRIQVGQKIIFPPLSSTD